MRIRQHQVFGTAIALCGIAIAHAALGQQATTSDSPLSDRRVAYSIDATLDIASRSISGTQRLRWRNPDRVPVAELQFHLYLNAFRNEKSTFMRESGGQHRGFSAEGDGQWGGIDIERMERVSTEDTGTLANPPGTRIDLTDAIRFIQPDDGNVDDLTVISVALDQPVAPGEWIDLDIAFESSLPQIVARTGWELTEDGEVFVMAAQWFPKIGVLEIPGQRYVPSDAPRGEWSTHQFHANSEFYADFGTYDVRLTVPANYIVGASGVLTEESDEETTRTVRYVAEDVHDFAWTASPSFLEVTDTWQHVNLRLLLRPEHRNQADRHLDAAKVGLEYFDKWVGPYPYTTLTLVDGYGGSNGMEYPTLITCGTYYGLPTWMRALELVTIHEFGHQYFYGMLASNEAEEAWLDEGMTSYLESKIMDAAYGEGALVDFPGLPVGSAVQQRMTYTESRPESGALFTKSWEYRSGDYGKASYAKPATLMNSLEGYLGEDRMIAFLRAYYDRWSFRHPTTRDLQDVAEDVAGEDLDWFFDQFVYGTAVVDYEVTEIQTDTESRVVVTRLADGYFPQSLRVTFADGAEEVVSWDGREKERVFTFDSTSPVVDAYVDHERQVLLDVNLVNNRMAIDPPNPFATKVHLKTTSWAQQLLYLIAGIL